VIPGNDDAIRAIRLLSSKIADAVIEGVQARDRQLQTAREGEEPAAATAGTVEVSEEEEVEA
jgi:small subunit ribosomal protein S2